MTLGVWMTCLAAVLGAGGCGADEDAPVTTTGSAGDGGSGGQGGAESDEPGAVLLCPPGQLWQDDGSCLAPGVPSDGCGDGFSHDGDRGCDPVLPGAPCPPGQLAVPGETVCRPVAECTGGSWGAIPTDGTTQHVDGSHSDTSTGSASQPWTTIQAGIDAAAPGAIVAVAGGSYDEAVVIQQSVILWGACPAEVSLDGPPSAAALTVQDEATSVVVRDLAITGQGQGILAAGPDDLLVERVWIHGTGEEGIVVGPGTGPTSVMVRDSLIDQATSLGVSVHGVTGVVERSVVRDIQPQGSSDAGLGVYADGGSGGQLTLRQTVVAGSPGVGVLARGSSLVIEDSVVHDTQPQLDLSRGLAVWGRAAELQRAAITVQRSVIETSYSYGLRADDSDLVVEHSVIRDILPQVSAPVDGMGLRIYGLDPDFTTRPQGRVTQSSIERVYDVGLQGSGVELELTALAVRDVEPRQNELTRGRGINLRYAAGNTERRSVGTIAGCRIERSHEAGIIVVGSDVDVDSCAVIDTRPRPLDGRLGFGVFYIRNLPVVSEGAAGTLTRSLVQEAHGAGVAVVASELTATDVIARDILPQAEAEDFGDGMAASATLLVVPDFFPTHLDITRATVERATRAGLASFAASMTVSDSLFACNPIDMNGEEMAGEPFTIEDRGGNQCGCSADDVLRQCRILSAGLEPPVAL